MQENEATHSEDAEKMEISLHHFVTEQELTVNSNISYEQPLLLDNIKPAPKNTLITRKIF